MRVVDAQLHVWEPDSPAHPWDATYRKQGPMEAANFEFSAAHPVPYDAALAMMDAARVHAALLVTPSFYAYDNSYALVAASSHPDRFAVIGRVDPLARDVAERVAEWQKTPGAVGIRVVVNNQLQIERLTSRRFDPLFAAAERRGVPLCIYPPRALREFGRVAADFPELSLTIDHLGLAQAPLAVDESSRFADVDHLLTLSQYPNVSVKMSAVDSLSRDRYPFKDVWPYLHKVISQFGTNRVMWGSDITRVGRNQSYESASDYVRLTSELTEHEKEAILGETLCRVFSWDTTIRKGH